MTRLTPSSLSKAAIVLLLAAGGSAAAAQAARSPQCVAANDEVTRHRIGRDRAGKAYPVNVGQAVAAGRRAEQGCRGDSGFLLAYALARLDQAKNIKGVSLEQRTSLFNGALADLEGLRARVAAGQSDRYEVFNILGLIYYETGQHQKSIAVLDASAPFLNRMTLVSRRNTFFTKGMAQYQLGRTKEAASSFAYARKFGHPEAAKWEAATRKAK